MHPTFQELKEEMQVAISIAKVDIEAAKSQGIETLKKVACHTRLKAAQRQELITLFEQI